MKAIPELVTNLPYHSKFNAEILKVEIGGVAIYRPFGEFLRAKSYYHLYDAKGQRQAYFLPLATMNFVGLDLTTSDRFSSCCDLEGKRVTSHLESNIVERHSYSGSGMMVCAGISLRGYLDFHVFNRGVEIVKNIEMSEREREKSLINI
ncbi:hypothetical protein TNCV_3239591 [Trichonephila clavipes]|nr:hypothetical protein TNCV_3239591 [Trichonephila clavipes]